MFPRTKATSKMMKIYLVSPKYKTRDDFQGEDEDNIDHPQPSKNEMLIYIV